MTGNSDRMNSFKNQRRGALCVLFILSFFGACTVSPKAPPPRSIAFYSGNSLNSGIIAATYDGPGRTNFRGFLVTQAWVDSYDSLARDYGYLLTPPAKPGTGATKLNQAWLVDAQHMVIWKDLQAQPGLGKPKQSLLGKLGL